MAKALASIGLQSPISPLPSLQFQELTLHYVGQLIFFLLLLLSPTSFKVRYTLRRSYKQAALSHFRPSPPLWSNVLRRPSTKLSGL